MTAVAFLLGLILGAGALGFYQRHLDKQKPKPSPHAFSYTSLGSADDGAYQMRKLFADLEKGSAQ
jgi:hypothetical protein